MGTPVESSDYWALRRHLMSLNLRLFVRRVAGSLSLGDSALGCTCFVLMVDALSIVLIFAISAFDRISLSAAILASGFVSALLTLSLVPCLLMGRTDEMKRRRREIVAQIPEAKAAWQAQRERLRTAQEMEKQMRQALTDSARQTSRSRGVSTIVNERARREYNVEVVGESHYQDVLERICGGRDEEGASFETIAELVLDDRNAYDSYAVRVEIQGQIVGYLSRENARGFRKQLASASPSESRERCDAIIVGGWDRGEDDVGHFGVKLSLPVSLS